MRENIASAYIIFYLIDKINIDDTISATLYTETAALKSVTSICVCGSILFIGNIYRHVTHICVRAFIFYGPIRIPTHTHTQTMHTQCLTRNRITLKVFQVKLTSIRICCLLIQLQTFRKNSFCKM